MEAWTWTLHGISWLHVQHAIQGPENWKVQKPTRSAHGMSENVEKEVNAANEHKAGLKSKRPI